MKVARLASLFLLLAAPLSAVNIDTFTTNQGTLSDPPGGNSSVAGAAGDPIGNRRGIVVDHLAGVGPTSVVVTGGNLSLTVNATTPDSRGEARISWDADTNALTLSPTGLSNANLMASDAAGFRLVFASSTVVAEIEITVYDDGTNFSRAGRRIPASGSPQTIDIPFAEFRVAGGTGAVFNSVGAIEMTVRSSEGTVNLNAITTEAPVLAATKVDAQVPVDVDGDGRVDPGDRVRYTVTITNTGNNATSVDLTDNVSSNTTLVPGSVSSTPVARNDQYFWFGNVTLTADSTPHPRLLANDADPDGDTISVQSGTFPATSQQSGTLTLVNAANGEFTYSPPAGFKGVDAFNYTIVDDNGNTSTATANIVLQGVVWFVDDSNSTPPHLGTQADPFQTLASVNGTDPDEPGDIIFLYDDNGTPYPGGHTMEADQEFIGEGVGLILGGETIVAAGSTPQMTNAAGAGITLGVDSTIRGIDVTGTSGAGIVGTSFGTFTASSVNVTTVGGATLDLATGNLATVFGTLSSAGTASQRGLQLVTVTGSLTATTTSLTNPTTQGIRVATSPAVVLDFGNTTITDNAGGGPTAIGIDVATGNAGASFTFDSLAVTTDAGAGILANGSGTINIGGTGNTIDATGGPAVSIISTSLGIGATFSTLTSTNSASQGVNLDNVTGSFTANGGSISGSSGVGFDLNGGAASVTYAGTVSKTSAGNLIEVTARGGGTATFSGNLSSTGAANGIDVLNNTSGSSAVNFSGATKTLNTGTSTAVQLTNNGAATINFTGGGLDIDTTSGNGFSAVSGAFAITVQGTGNTIFANGAGMALDVASSSIGTPGLTFQSISAGTASGSFGNGISLDGTGLAAGNGGLTVTGTGSAGSGGTIQHKTGVDNSVSSGNGIFLRNTKNASFSWMQLNDFDNSGILGRNVQGFTLQNSVLNGAIGNASGPTEGAIAFGTSNPSGTNGLQGTGLLRNNRISGSIEHQLEFYNQSGSMNLTIDGTALPTAGANPADPSDDTADCVIEENSTALGSDGLQIELQTDGSGGTPTATVLVDRCLFRDNKSQAIQVNALGGSNITLTIDESRATKNLGAGGQGNEGFVLQNGNSGVFDVTVSNNVLFNIGGSNIFVGQVAGNALSSSNLVARVLNNTMTAGSATVYPTNRTLLAFFSSTLGQHAPANVRFHNNNITTFSDPVNGLAEVIFVSTPDANTDPYYTARVTNNTVTINDPAGTSLRGIGVQATQGAAAPNNAQGCFLVSGNNVNYVPGPPAGVNGLRVRQVGTATARLERGAALLTDPPTTVLDVNNPATVEVVGTVTVVENGTCLPQP